MIFCLRNSCVALLKRREGKLSNVKTEPFVFLHVRSQFSQRYSLVQCMISRLFFYHKNWAYNNVIKKNDNASRHKLQTLQTMLIKKVRTTKNTYSLEQNII